MRVQPFNPIYKQFRSSYKTDIQNNTVPNTIDNRSQINSLPSYNAASLSFKAKLEHVTMSLDELKRRTDNEHLMEYKLLDINSPEYNNLQLRDKMALLHLLKAGRVLNNVYLKIDNVHNVNYKNYLEDVARHGSEIAKLSLEIFNAQKGLNAKDITGQMVSLNKNYPVKPGCGFYPEDLTISDFHNISIKMLKNGKQEMVRDILNQRSIVVRDGKELKAVDFVDYFQREFKKAAGELSIASCLSSDEDFNEFLHLQAKALLKADPELDAKADKKWVSLQNAPLEFTISRESYFDKMTPTVLENKELKDLLDKYNITPYAKDVLGIRIGIVNKEGTDYLLKIREQLPFIAENMPFNNEYEQNFAFDQSQQSMLDVDLVDMQGDMGAYRNGISVASVLPNNDKLAVQQGCGRKTVYHRQIRNRVGAHQNQKKLDALLTPSLHKYYDTSRIHDFIILHENMHALGPKEWDNLGVYKNIIEENKADVAAMAMLDLLTKRGFFTEKQAKQIITSFLVNYVLKGPDFDNAHRKRNIMQYNYFFQNGAIKLDKKGRIDIDFKKFKEQSKQLLERIIRIQIEANPQKAKEYIDEYAVWTPELDVLGNKLKAVDKALAGKVVTPLADKMLKQKI